MGKWQCALQSDVVSNPEKLPASPGVYQVKLVKKERLVKIGRLSGTDCEGILSIGSTDNLRRRLTEFLRASEGKRGHSEGTKWWLAKVFNPKLREPRLVFKYKTEKSEKIARNREKKEIQRYLRKYGEPPPLNGAIPRRRKWVRELRRKYLARD
jgi:hypothetical protein